MNTNGRRPPIRDYIDMWAEETNTPLVVLDGPGLDQAILGVADGPGQTPRVAYSTQKIVRALIQHQHMEWDEAWEWFHFKIETAYMGDHSPTYIYEHQ